MFVLKAPMTLAPIVVEFVHLVLLCSGSAL
jgi:hypothetical protein